MIIFLTSNSFLSMLICVGKIRLPMFAFFDFPKDFHAEVAESADALRSGRSGLKPVGVQIPPSAP